MLARVTAVQYLHDYVLEIHFADGSQGQVDFRRWVVGRGGVFTSLEDLDFFKQVRVDSEAGTISWPNDVDFCPDMLHHEATGTPLPGVEEQRSATGV